MKDKIAIFNIIIIFWFLIIFSIISYSQTLTISYIPAAFLFIIFSGFVFSGGILINEKRNYKKNINLYIIMYFVLLICLTMFINRSGFGLIDKEYFLIYIKSINLIPFKTIIEYLTSQSNLNIVIYNILGNFVALMPLSLLLTLKDDKYTSTKSQIIYLSLTVIIIEVLQFILSAGRFDIDDYILNVGGAVLFFVFINRIKAADKIRNLFYTDFHLSNIIKKIIYVLMLIIVLGINTIVSIEYTENRNYQKNPYHQYFFVETLDECTQMEKYEIGEYNIYLSCINIIYENNIGEQVPIIDAIKDSGINDIREKLILNETLNNGTLIYKNEIENLTAIICSSPTPKNNIYFGNFEMEYKNYCE